MSSLESFDFEYEWLVLDKVFAVGHAPGNHDFRLQRGTTLIGKKNDKFHRALHPATLQWQRFGSS